MTALNQGTYIIKRSGLYLSWKGKKCLTKFMQNYAIKSTLIIKQKQFLEHFVETTNVSPNADYCKHFTIFNCFFIT